MTDTGTNGAAVRAADAMLNALGGMEITFIFPLVALPNDPSAQLGLADPGVQQVAFRPAAVRSLESKGTGPRRRLEFLISGSAVAAALPAQNCSSGEALFDSALGINYDSDVFHIEDVVIEYFAGIPYLYKVTAAV